MATRIAITLMGKHKPIYDQASQSPFARLAGLQAAPGQLELTFTLLALLQTTVETTSWSPTLAR